MRCRTYEFTAPVFRPDVASEPALSAAADFAAGWTLQCTLSAVFAGDVRPMVLYRSEQVIPYPKEFQQAHTFACLLPGSPGHL